ncbi:unnamed protein product [Fraxinus pennsylvanica]|uniref:Uncharacterized protein n=1 Tax=Fraxinus pennsylvanica TaxID=56036 RepID=A0AAD1ZQA3_9LAMI|nr:unnamed protein product [Fraxinus pennsylvanica]
MNSHYWLFGFCFLLAGSSLLPLNPLSENTPTTVPFPHTLQQFPHFLSKISHTIRNMYWITAKNVVVPRWRSLSLLFSLPFHHRHSFFSSSSAPLCIRQSQRILCVKERKYFTRTTKKQKQLKNVLEEKDYAHIMWWKERIQMCRKPSSVLLVKRLTYSNLLGIDTSLRNGRHAHPGSPYVFGLVGDDHDLDFPEPMPVVGISRSAKGYCMISVLETMKTYSAEDGLTEEALVTKIRSCQCHHLFLHSSLKNNSSGTCRWREFGEGGLLWGECNSRQFEWFEGNPVNALLFKVKELYGLEDDVTFRNVTVTSEDRPRPLHLGTATQIGALPTEGIPCLLKVLLPSNCTGLPVLYVRDLLLNPPPYEIASTIQGNAQHVLIFVIMCLIFYSYMPAMFS